MLDRDVALDVPMADAILWYLFSTTARAQQNVNARRVLNGYHIIPRDSVVSS